MRIGAIAFRPALVPTLAAALAIALTVFLGHWQAGRAAQKRELQALFDARANETPVRLGGSAAGVDALLYRRVRIGGEWIASRQIFIDNQVENGRAGFHVITPLAIEGTTSAVLVNRGWIARNREYPLPPRAEPPAGHVELVGMATVPPRRVLELSSQTVAGNVWQNLSIERYAQSSKLALVPVVVLAESTAAGLVPVKERPDAGVDRHREYSLTWYSLAATVLALWIGLNMRRVR